MNGYIGDSIRLRQEHTPKQSAEFVRFIADQVTRRLYVGVEQGLLTGVVDDYVIEVHVKERQ